MENSYSKEENRYHKNDDDILRESNIRNVLDDLKYFLDDNSYNEEEAVRKAIERIRKYDPECADQLEDFFSELTAYSKFGRARSAYMNLKMMEIERMSRGK